MGEIVISLTTVSRAQLQHSPSSSRKSHQCAARGLQHSVQVAASPLELNEPVRHSAVLSQPESESHPPVHRLYSPYTPFALSLTGQHVQQIAWTSWTTASFTNAINSEPTCSPTDTFTCLIDRSADTSTTSMCMAAIYYYCIAAESTSVCPASDSYSAWATFTVWAQVLPGDLLIPSSCPVPTRYPRTTSMIPHCALVQWTLGSKATGSQDSWSRENLNHIKLFFSETG